MTQLVLDVSATIAWFIPDEKTPLTQTLLTQVVEQGAIVPLIWPIGVANALLMATRRQRISALQRRHALENLSELQLSSDDETFDRAWGPTLELAERFGLTLYDACDLELAYRRGLPLASFDKELRAAAGTLGVGLFGM